MPCLPKTLLFAEVLVQTGFMRPDIARLGQLVKKRRLELRRTQVDVYRAGGPSDTTLTGLEQGTATSVSKDTLRKLDVGLDWEPGSATRVYLREGDPETLPKQTRRGITRPFGELSAGNDGSVRYTMTNHPVTNTSMIQLMIALSRLGLRLEDFRAGEMAAEDFAEVVEEVLETGADAVAEWMGGPDQMSALGEALQYLTKQANPSARSAAIDGDNGVDDASG
jgi:hypothetical protein